MKTVFSILLFTVVSFAVMMWHFNRPPFDLAKLQQLQKGMTQQQVRQILGEPRRIDSTGWHYARLSASPCVLVRFNGSGKLESHDYDY